MKYIKKKDITKEWLLKNDFRYNRYFSTKEDAVFTQRFAVVSQGRDKKKPSLECEMLIYYPEGSIHINVYHAGTRDKYAPFYDSQYGNWDKILGLINKKINNKLNKLGVKIIE